LVLNALTIDVEEYFHAENLRAAYPRESWDALESRVEEPLGRLRDLLRERGLRATFFVLGWLAERRPWIVRELARDGHEIASHGFGHELLTRLDENAFRQDLARATLALAPLAGRRPRGYRAPCFTIVPETRWVFPILADLGFDYDSSVFPIRHDRYGDPAAPRELHAITVGGGESERTIAEAPPATVRLLGRNLPIAGGGYLRLLPLRACAAGIEALNARGEPAVVYVHPWELDPGQPRHQGVSWLARVRHGIGTAGLEAKLARLLDRFAFGTLEQVLEGRGLLPCVT
jgi:polysaccharide deacetylase family protein (PEP-CTERM system associated)